jgi:hypothetical protein
MPIPVTCDGCGARFKAPDAAAGKKGKCPKCGQRIVVPAPAAPAAAAMEDDMYDLASGDPAPMPAPSPLPPTPPPYNPPSRSTTTVSSSAMSRGVVPKSASAGDWKKSNNPPTIMKVLAVIGGGFLILLGLLFTAGPILIMMSDKTGKTIRFKGVFIGVAMIVTGITTIAKAFSKGD